MKNILEEHRLLISDSLRLNKTHTTKNTCKITLLQFQFSLHKCVIFIKTFIIFQCKSYLTYTLIKEPIFDLFQFQVFFYR